MDERFKIDDPALTPAERFARITEGVWTRTPPPSWALQDICVFGSAKPHSLIIPRQSKFRHGVKLDLKDERLKDCALLVSHDFPLTAHLPQLRVQSVSEAVAAIAKLRRASHRGIICAVTGSAGKSSTCALLHHAASTLRDFAKLRPTANYFDSLTAQLAQLPGAQSAILEVAMVSLPRASWILKPDLALLTSVAPAHLHRRKSLSNIANRKAQIFSGLRKGGTAIINRDIPFFERVHSIAREHAGRIVSYGCHIEADIRLLDYDPTRKLVKASVWDRDVEYELGMLGRHMAINSLGVIAALDAMAFNTCLGIKSFSSAITPSGRGRCYSVTVSGKHIHIIDDCYNANPLSMQAGLELLARYPEQRRRIAVLSDMLELGSYAAAHHADLIFDLQGTTVDTVFTAGELMGNLWDRLPESMRGAKVGSAGRLLPLLLRYVRDGDVVLFKGSRGTGLHTVVEALRQASLDT